MYEGPLTSKDGRLELLVSRDDLMGGEVIDGREGEDPSGGRLIDGTWPEVEVALEGLRPCLGRTLLG